MARALERGVNPYANVEAASQAERMAPGPQSFNAGGGMAPYPQSFREGSAAPFAGPLKDSFMAPPPAMPGPPVGPATPPAPPPSAPFLPGPHNYATAHGHFASRFGRLPQWGPEFLPPRKPGDPPPEPPPWEPFPRVGREALIPTEWMAYRHSEWRWENPTATEPTVYRDSRTMRPTVRSQMGPRPQELMASLETSLEEAQEQLNEAVLDENPLGELQKGLEVMGRDMEKNIGIGTNGISQSHPIMAPDFQYYTKQGVIWMNIRNPLEGVKDVGASHFEQPAMKPVSTYVGSQLKAHDPRRSEDCRIG